MPGPPPPPKATTTERSPEDADPVGIPSTSSSTAAAEAPPASHSAPTTPTTLAAPDGGPGADTRTPSGFDCFREASLTGTKRKSFPSLSFLSLSPSRSPPRPPGPIGDHEDGGGRASSPSSSSVQMQVKLRTPDREQHTRLRPCVVDLVDLLECDHNVEFSSFCIAFVNAALTPWTAAAAGLAEPPGAPEDAAGLEILSLQTRLVAALESHFIDNALRELNETTDIFLRESISLYYRVRPPARPPARSGGIGGRSRGGATTGPPAMR